MSLLADSRETLRAAARCLDNNRNVAAEVLSCVHVDEEHIASAKQLAKLSEACFEAAVAEYLRRLG
jgi:hypothetical protein